MPALELHLPGVTLCAVDTRTPDLALQALARSMQGVCYGATLFFTHDPLGHQAQAAAALGIQVVDIPPLASITDYSVFVLRRLVQHIHTSHVLLTQWDGFVCNPAMWQPAFLEYDYVGAPWPQYPAERSVGNGGFSLRSRKLLQALLDPDIQISHPEDLCICHQNRGMLETRYQINFAPPIVAAAFSRERGPTCQGTFGFHGAFHLLHILDAADLQALIERLPQSMSRSMEIKNLARALLQRGRKNDLELAHLLIQKRFAAGLRDLPQWRLWIRAWWQRVLSLSAGRHTAFPSSRHDTNE